MPDIKIKDDILVELLSKQLKEKIREEVKRELYQQQFTPKPKPWEKVRDHIENELRNTLQRWHTYKIQNAIYTIIKYSLDINRVTELPEEQIDQAIDISNSCLSMIALEKLSNK